MVGGSNPEASANKTKYYQNSLRILQWNANGIATKANELGLRLKADRIDVALVQETKMKHHHRTPRLEGYSPIRCDRPNQDGGGGLLCYIKDSIIFERVGDSSICGTESSSIRIKMGKRKWAVITNIYCPPSRSHTDERSLHLADGLAADNAIIAGDLNAHDQLWDTNQPPDGRGALLLDWCLDHDLTILNSGSPTRTNIRQVSPQDSTTSGGLSTPDVTLCGKTWANKAEWEVLEAIGSSDHLPILVTINEKITRGSVFKGKARWRSTNVDWSKFTAAVESAVTSIDPSLPLGDRVSFFTKTLIQAGNTHVGKTKPGSRTKSWVTPAVKDAIRHRNRLRRHVRERRQEWTDACATVQAKIAEAKLNAWRAVIEDATPDRDDTKMWRIIRSLKDAPDSNAPNEAMKYGDRLVTDDRRKADIFARHYAGVSDLPMSKADRRENLLLRKRLSQLRKSPLVHEPITADELNEAIRRMKPRGACGPDSIPPSFLIHMGPLARQELLSLFNCSLSTGLVPQAWRNAEIIPILKSGKPPADITSFRPISLTSCVGKLMERVVSERLYHLTEASDLLSPSQAGFRKGRGVEDQLLRLSQALSHGFQRKDRSILALLDFSKAYDTVWRQRLLLSLLALGIPPTYVLWLSGFLLNRQARVTYNGATSRSHKMAQGLPQGAVLAPVLFIIYINSLACRIPPTITTLIYADDVSLLAQHRSLSAALEALQSATDVVTSWSGEWKLQLNGAKTEVCAFTLDPAEAKWVPHLKVNGVPARFNPTPRFLGVILDRTLSFGAHVSAIAKKATSKLRLLAAVCNTSWGWRKLHLRKLFQTHILSVITYAGAGWLPWLSQTNATRLEAIQNKALRLITTQARSSPVEALRAEAGVQSVATLIRACCVRSREKALRLPLDHPRRIAFQDAPPPRRLKRWDARSRADSIAQCDPQLHAPAPRLPIRLPRPKPWERGLPRTEVYPQLAGIDGRLDPTAAIQRAASARAREVGTDYTIYTDGSAEEGTFRGGAGAVVTTGDPNSPEVVATLLVRGAHLTCSYDEECRAMGMALEWVARLPADKTVAIFTDSQSLCQAIQNRSQQVENILESLRALPSGVTIQWVPGHSNIPGNELADCAAKKAASTSGSPAPVSYGSVCSHIGRVIRDPPISHERTRAVYGGLTASAEATISSRADQSLLARLRSGHFVGLRAYRHRLDPSVDPTCDLCGEGEQDLIHWLVQCPATEAERRHLFGPDSGRLDCLTRHPRGSVALARSTLLGARGGNPPPQ